MGVSEEAVSAMQAYLRLKRYILPSGILREALQAAAPFLQVQPSAARKLALERISKILRGDVETDTIVTAVNRLNAAIDIALRALSSPDHADAGKVEGDGLPQDVINLVIAAREVWEEADTLSYYHSDEEFSQRVKALDKALEPFGERVPFENEPSAPASEGAE